MDGVGCVYGVELAFTWLDLNTIIGCCYLLPCNKVSALPIGLSVGKILCLTVLLEVSSPFPPSTLFQIPWFLGNLAAWAVF